MILPAFEIYPVTTHIYDKRDWLDDLNQSKAQTVELHKQGFKSWYLEALRVTALCTSRGSIHTAAFVNGASLLSTSHRSALHSWQPPVLQEQSECAWVCSLAETSLTLCFGDDEMI